MKEYTVEEYQAQVPVLEYMETCVDVPKFLSYCKACKNYGTVWSCPPFDFSPEELWRGYQTLCLYGRKVIISQKLREQVFPPEELGQKSKELLREEKERLLSFLMEQERELPGSMVLSAGSCEGCQPQGCARCHGKPCRHPGKMRHSMEALGADVVLTVSRYLHQEIVWGKEGRFPEYYFLVGGLLVPGQPGSAASDK